VSYWAAELRVKFIINIIISLIIAVLRASYYISCNIITEKCSKSQDLFNIFSKGSKGECNHEFFGWKEWGRFGDPVR
jgi:hypothetical protein